MNPLFATRFFDLPSSLFVHGNHFCVENECHHVCVRGTQISKKEACDNDEIFLIEDAFIAFGPIKHLATEHRILQTLYYVVMKPFGKSFDLFIDAIVELDFDYDDYLLHYQHKYYGTISNYCVKMKPSRYIYEAELDVYFEKGFLPVRLEGIVDSCAFSLNDPKNQNAYFSTLETLHPHPKFIHSWV
ncbi:MAG: hypothetical protein EOM50_23510, partial [Erysipelotrichia bacterium]|nr:hypothetical protein [Erysipelotrichia bacterium]